MPSSRLPLSFHFSIGPSSSLYVPSIPPKSSFFSILTDTDLNLALLVFCPQPWQWHWSNVGGQQQAMAGYKVGSGVCLIIAWPSPCLYSPPAQANCILGFPSVKLFGCTHSCCQSTGDECTWSKPPISESFHSNPGSPTLCQLPLRSWVEASLGFQVKRLQVDNGFSGGERSLKARSSGIARSKRFPGSGEQQLLPRPPQVLPATPEAESHLGLKSCSEGIRRRILDNSVWTSGDFFSGVFSKPSPKI